MNARNNRILPITWAIRAVASSMPTAEIQQELHRIGGGIPLGRVRTMHQVVAASAARTQFYTMLLTVFAGIALVLAAVGLYCLMAYSVQQRTPEIGIRMALGASPGDVRSIVMRQGMRLALLGILLGIPAALGLARIAVRMIFRHPDVGSRGAGSGSRPAERRSATGSLCAIPAGYSRESCRCVAQLKSSKAVL
jgi:ABC-type antimicrobial peptide transport system permease subunit